jgi:hypothetical protein
MGFLIATGFFFVSCVSKEPKVSSDILNQRIGWTKMSFSPQLERYGETGTSNTYISAPCGTGVHLT